jgi:hypothetical protein
VYRNLKENGGAQEPEAQPRKAEPATEILFLCSYDGCGKTFVDVAALRKHAHVHNERQYACQEPGCGKVHPVKQIYLGPLPMHVLSFENLPAISRS